MTLVKAADISPNGTLSKDIAAPREMPKILLSRLCSYIPKAANSSAAMTRTILSRRSLYSCTWKRTQGKLLYYTIAANSRNACMIRAKQPHLRKPGMQGVFHSFTNIQRKLQPLTNSKTIIDVLEPAQLPRSQCSVLGQILNVYGVMSEHKLRA